MAAAIAILLSLIGSPALAVGEHGSCTGTVVGAGTVVFDDCTLETFAGDVSVYIEPSEEPLAAFAAYPGRLAGRVIVRFNAGDVQ